MEPRVDEILATCGVEYQPIAECVYIIEEAVLQPTIRIVPVPALGPERDGNPSNLQPMEQRPGNPVLHMEEQYYGRRVEITNHLAIRPEVERQLLKAKLD